MKDYAGQRPLSELPEVLLGERVEAITDALAARVSEIIEMAPPEPCTERDFWNIPLLEWRRALDEWCANRFVRAAYGFETTEGLRAALGDFDDDTFLSFLESLL